MGELAVAALADRALHVPLQRDVDAIGRHTAVLERLRYEAHHHLRSADHRGRPGALEGGDGDQPGDQADAPVPAAGGAVDRRLDLDPGLAPGLELSAP